MNLNDFKHLCEHAYCRVCYEPFEALNIVYKENPDPSDLVRAILSLFNKRNFFDRGKALLFCGHCKLVTHKGCYEPEQTYPIEVQLSKSEKLSLRYFECHSCLASQGRTDKPVAINCHMCGIAGGLLIPLRINQLQLSELSEDRKSSRKFLASDLPISPLVKQAVTNPTRQQAIQNQSQMDSIKSYENSPGIKQKANDSAGEKSSLENIRPKASFESQMQEEELESKVDVLHENDPSGIGEKFSEYIAKDSFASATKSNSQPPLFFCHAPCGLFNQGTYISRKEIEIPIANLSKKNEDKSPCNFCNQPLKFSITACAERFCNVKVHMPCLLEERTQYMVSNKIDRNNAILWNVQPSFSITPIQDTEDNAYKEKVKLFSEPKTKARKLSAKESDSFRATSIIPNCDQATADTINSLYESLRDIGLFKFNHLNHEYFSIIKQVTDNYRLSLKFVNCLSLLCERHKRINEPCICGETQKSPRLIECENCFNWVHVECELERDADVAKFVCTKCRIFLSLERELSNPDQNLDSIAEELTFIKKVNLSIYEYLHLSKVFGRNLAFFTRTRPMSIELLEGFSEVRTTDPKTQTILVNQIIQMILQKCYTHLLAKISKFSERHITDDILQRLITKIEDQNNRISQLKAKFSGHELDVSCQREKTNIESLYAHIQTFGSASSSYFDLLYSIYQLISENPGLSPEFRTSAERCLYFFKAFVDYLKRQFNSLNLALDQSDDKTDLIIEKKILLLPFLKENKEVVNSNHIVQRILPVFLDHYKIIRMETFAKLMDPDNDALEKIGSSGQSLSDKKSISKTFYVKLIKALTEKIAKQVFTENSISKRDSQFKKTLQIFNKSFFEYYQISKSNPNADLKFNPAKYEKFVHQSSKIMASAILAKKLKIKEVRDKWESGWLIPLEAVEKFLSDNEEFNEADSYIKLKFSAQNSRQLFKMFSNRSTSIMIDTQNNFAEDQNDSDNLRDVVSKLLERHGFLHSELIYRLIAYDGIRYIKRYLQGKEVYLGRVKEIIEELGSELKLIPISNYQQHEPKEGEPAETFDQPNFLANSNENQSNDKSSSHDENNKNDMEVENSFSDNMSMESSRSEAIERSANHKSKGRICLDLHRYLSQDQIKHIQQAIVQINNHLSLIQISQQLIIQAIRNDSVNSTEKSTTIDQLQDAIKNLSEVNFKEFSAQVNGLLGIDNFLQMFGKLIPIGINISTWTLEEIVRLGLKSKNFIEEFLKHNKFKGVTDVLNFLILFDKKNAVIREAFLRLARYYVEERLRKAEANGQINFERVCEALNILEQIKDNSFYSYIKEKKIVVTTLKFFNKLKHILSSKQTKKTWLSFFNNNELDKILMDFKTKAQNIIDLYEKQNSTELEEERENADEEMPLDEPSLTENEENCQFMLNQLESLGNSLVRFEQTDRIAGLSKRVQNIKRYFVLIYNNISLLITHRTKPHIKFEIDFNRLAKDFHKTQKLILNPKNVRLLEAIDFTKKLLDYHNELKSIIPKLVSQQKTKQDTLLIVSIANQNPESFIALERVEELKRRGSDFQNFLFEEYQQLKYIIGEIKDLESEVLTEIKDLQKRLSTFISKYKYFDRTPVETGTFILNYYNNIAEEDDTIVFNDLKMFFILQDKFKAKSLLDLAPFEQKYLMFRDFFQKLNCSSRALRERLVHHEFLIYVIRLLMGPKTLKDLTLFANIKIKQFLRNSHSDLEAFEFLSSLAKYINNLTTKNNEEIDIAEVESFYEFEFGILPNDFSDIPEKGRKRLIALQTLSFLLKGLRRKPVTLSSMEYKSALDCLFTTECQMSRELSNIILRAIKRETRLVKLKIRLFGPPKFPFAGRYLLDKYTELLEFDQSEMEELARKYLVQLEKYFSIKFKLIKDDKYSLCSGSPIDYESLWSVFDTKKEIKLNPFVVDQLAKMRNIIRFVVGCEQTGSGHINDCNQTFKYIAQGMEPWKIRERDFKQGLAERSLLVHLTAETLSPGENESIDISNLNSEFAVIFSELKSLDLLDPVLILILQIQLILNISLSLSKERILIKISDLRFLISKTIEIRNTFSKSELSAEICNKANELIAPSWHYFVSLFKDSQEYLKSLTTHSFEAHQSIFKHRAIVSLNEVLAQPNQFKDEKIDSKSGFDKYSKTEFSFIGHCDVSSMDKLLKEFEKAILIENDKKYKDKKDRYNLNLKDVKTDFKATVSEEVASHKALIFSQQELKLKQMEDLEADNKFKTYDSGSKKYKSHMSHKGKKRKYERENPEFSPIASEKQSVDFEEAQPKEQPQPKNLFRNLISDSREPKEAQIEPEDILELENDEVESDEDDNKIEESNQNNLYSMPIRGIGNLQSMLGQLKFWQMIKRSIQENPRFKVQESQNNLTAFSKKLENNYNNLKILYPQISDGDIIEFLKQYKYINRLLNHYVKEKITFADFIGLVSNPKKKIGEPTKKVSKSHKQNDTLLNELFEDQDVDQQKSEAKNVSLKTKSKQPSTEYSEQLLTKTEAYTKHEELTPPLSSNKRNESYSDSNDLLKRIKLATSTPKYAPPIIRFDFPKKNRIIFISDKNSEEENIYSGLRFITCEPADLISGLPFVERPPKIRLNQFKKAVGDIEKDWKVRDKLNPNIVVGIVEINDLDEALRQAFEEKTVWGYSCSPTLQFYIGHLSVIDLTLFEALEPLFLSEEGRNINFDNAYVFFLKRTSGVDKQNKTIEFSLIPQTSPHDENVTPKEELAPIEKFKALVLQRQQHKEEKMFYSNVNQSQEFGLHYDLANPQRLPIPMAIPGSGLPNFPMPQNPNLMAFAPQEINKGRNEPAILAALRLNQQRQAQQVSQPPQPTKAEPVYSQNQGNLLLNDLRQSNQGSIPMKDLGKVPPQMPYFFNPQQANPLQAFAQNLQMQVPPYPNINMGNMPPMMGANSMAPLPFFNPMSMNMPPLQNIGQLGMPMMPQMLNPNLQLPTDGKQSGLSAPLPNAVNVGNRPHIFDPMNLASTLPKYNDHTNNQLPINPALKPVVQPPIELFKHNFPTSTEAPITSKSNIPPPMMSFNFENANEEFEEESEDMVDQNLKQNAFVAEAQNQVSFNQPSNQAIDQEQEDPELIELVVENDAETLAECYKDAEDNLKRLLFKNIQVYAPMKLQLFMQLIGNN